MKEYNLTLSERSKGTLNAGGGYSEKNPAPPHKIEISATNHHLVVYEQKLYGDSEDYTVVYEVENRNDSPAFFKVLVDEPADESN